MKRYIGIYTYWRSLQSRNKISIVRIIDTVFGTGTDKYLDLLCKGVDTYSIIKKRQHVPHFQFKVNKSDNHWEYYNNANCQRAIHN